MKHALILAVAMLSLAACDSSAPTSPSFGQGGPQLATTSQWVPLNGTFPNDCPPAELVAFSGRAHLLIRQNADEFKFFANWGDVRGVGLATGGQYVVQDNYHDVETTTATGGIAESFERIRLIRQGSPENLVGFAHVIFDLGTGEFILADFRIQCRG
jgi:hypothetical protein